MGNMKSLKNQSEGTNAKLLNEKGIALVMVLVLSAIALAIMAGLIFMITSGTQVSGIQKRYKTSLDAGMGGADVAYRFISLRGDQTLQDAFINALNDPVKTGNLQFAYSSAISSCTGTTAAGTTYTGLAAKLNTSKMKPDGSLNWINCDSSLTVGPSNYDMKFDLGVLPTYRVYAKIVDTVEGNSGPDEGLINTGVVKENTSQGKPLSFLYTVEVDSENLSNPSERSKLSILYQY